MNILYGIQGTGNGHMSRSREIVSQLKERHTVHCVLSGREKKDYFDIEPFAPYTIFKGITFSHKHNKIDVFETLKQIDFVTFFQDAKKIRGTTYDLVVTDFEPITSLYAAKYGIPSLGVSHQYAFKLEDSLMQDLDLTTKMVVSAFAPALQEIGLHWIEFNDNVMHPVIAADVRQLSQYTEEDFYLLYLPWESSKEIRHTFSQFKEKFVIYDKRNIETANINHRKLNRQKFIRDLSRCKGVVCNSGFQLLSEAIFLNKRILTIPLRDQKEQESNARLIREYALGVTATNLHQHTLFKSWFERDIRPNYPLRSDTVSRILNIIEGYVDKPKF